MLLPNSLILDRYRTKSLLGRGGMGEVWLSFDENLQRDIVLKTVSHRLCKENPQYSSIFIDEARIGASLVGHPNVVNVFDIINKNDGDSYPLLAIAMEFVEGMSCAEWIAKSNQLVDNSTKHYLNLMASLEICKAISYAHRHSILHRDIKPLNVFMSKYGITKIGDFGIARYADAVTREHTVCNFRSPAYSAPEQWKDEKSTTNTDIYQLGCTLFHLFTGRLPFVATNPAALVHMHLTEIPISPNSLNPLISNELSSQILKCLTKSPEDRPELWKICDAIAKDLQKTYSIFIEFDKSNSTLIKKIADITEFSITDMKKSGNFDFKFVDFNEALSEAFALIMLPGIKIKLSITSPSRK